MQPVRLIFLVGNARSGTTLLATMLGRHSQIAAMPETHFLNKFSFRIRPYLRKSVPALVEKLQKTRLRHLNIDSEDIITRLADGRGLSLAIVFRTVLECFARKHNKPTILEKTPGHIRHIDQILRWYPGARIIWIVRDGRACLASLKSVDWATSDIKTLSRQWVRNMSYALAAERRHPGAIARIRYEDLAAAPQNALMHLHKVLEIPFEPAELDSGIESLKNPEFERPWKSNVSRPVERDRVHAWRQELSPDEIDRATAIMRRTLVDLGYKADGGGDRDYFAIAVTHEIWRRVFCSDFGLAAMMAAYRMVKSIRN